MRWLKTFWFGIKYIYGKFMNTIILPTVSDEGKYIDKNRVQCAYVFTRNGKKFIHCFVDGVLYFLVWTKKLERWLIASGFDLSEFDHIPENGKIAIVSNIPEKYKREPKPKF